MQTQLPFFPSTTKLVNSSVGIYENDEFVYYLHNGNPIYCHGLNDKNSYRFILGNLVVNNLCTITELSDCLGVNRKNIERYANTFRQKGAEYFFSRKETRGQCYKFTPNIKEKVQVRLDEGCSYYSIAREYGISEAAIRYHIHKGTLKKKSPVTSSGSLPDERNKEYLQASEVSGMAATRLEERVQSAFGLLPAAPVRFESCRSVALGGVMLLLPFLLECGLLSYRDHYSQRKGYYTFDSLMITLSFLFLLRIKTPESSKLYNPGEIGKLVGSDRIPEVKKLRGMIGELTRAGKSYDWGKDLSCRWISEEEPQLYYVDGHVQVYHGYLAELGKKHVSRQRLCLPGMMEFWINSAEGLPYFFITAPVNEKMIEMLESEIIPRLLELHTISPEQQELMDADPDYPLFTLVFDREGYSPALFKRLWKTYRIAVLTYRKHVKDEWDEGVFQEVRVDTRLGETTMQLYEEELLLDDYSMREVRRLTASGHQTSIITSNRKLAIALIASHMFGRWVQENFFRYLRQEYAFDSIIKYAVDKLDDNYMVVNREYSNITYRIKKTREKLSRFKATLYDHSQAAPQEKDNDKPTVYMKKWFSRQLELTEQIEEVNAQINSMVEKRKTIKYKIPLGEIPESSRYVQLHQESKMFQNIIKMIAYRAETALANKLMPYYSRAEDEVRSLIKAITKLSIDLMPDMDKRELSITLYPLSNNRSQKALEKIMDEVNASKTIYPGTDLIMVFKMTTI